jgi:hypothetical protein
VDDGETDVYCVSSSSSDPTNPIFTGTTGISALCGSTINNTSSLSVYHLSLFQPYFSTSRTPDIRETVRLPSIHRLTSSGRIPYKTHVRLSNLFSRTSLFFYLFYRSVTHSGHTEVSNLPNTQTGTCKMTEEENQQKKTGRVKRVKWRREVS